MWEIIYIVVIIVIPSGRIKHNNESLLLSYEVQMRINNVHCIMSRNAEDLVQYQSNTC